MKTNQVLQGDCLELLPSIPSKSIDMILCDLPYGTTACSWDSIIPLDRLWAEYERVIKDNGNIVLTAQGVFCAELICYRKTWFNHDYVWIKNQHSNFALAGIQPLRVFENVLVFRPPRREDKPMIFNQELRTYFKQVHDFIGLTAEKIAKIIGDTGYHHSYGVNGIQFRLCTQNTYDKLIACFKIDQMQGYLTYETLRSMNRDFFDPFTFNFDDRVKSITKTYSNGFAYDMYKGDNKKNYIGHIKKEYENYPRNTLYYNCERGLHPTQKPVALFEYLIRTYSNENEVILDNCSGSGTTAIACLNSNRRFVCMERDETYYKRSLERIANHEPLLHLASSNNEN